MIYYRTPKGNTTLTVLFSLVYFSVLRGDNCPAGSFDSVECHILMTLSTQSSHHASSSFFHTWITPLVKQHLLLRGPGGELIDRFTTAAIHETIDELGQRRKSELEVERERICQGLNCHPWLLPFHCSPIPCFIFSPPSEVVMTILNTVSMESHFTISFIGATLWKRDHLDLLPGQITNFPSILFMALWGCYLEGGL